ncbi:MAG TPA: L-glutamate gamma-semialdehyde dehydrogenase [Candidatus Obscuribacterales bacterium]
MLTEFRNEPLTDFSDAHNQKLMSEAIERVKKQLGKTYPLVIGGKKIEGKADDYLISTNPSDPKQVIGRFAKASIEQAEQAMQAALSAFRDWQNVPPHDRARYLFKSAAILRRKKFDLSAWLILEIGKNWAEADADVAEAIDFCEFYGREMIRLSQPQPLVAVQGEENELFYIPLGVGVVIPPWNFPLAILVGMTTAAIVSGNTVVLKPSSETPAIAYQFVEVLEEAGLPDGVLNFLPGPGSTVGDYLITHPKTRFIAFTGSKEIGLRINELAAKARDGQLWIKRVIAEMGGKDSIIVDSDSDLDQAADGVVASAFGFQGQKCSACSRVIVHQDVYDQMVQKIKERTEKLTMGTPEEHKNFIGPVSSKSAYESILQYIEVGKGEGKIITGGKAVNNGGGFFIQPTVISDVSPNARIAQEEIFGPVLAVIKAKDWNDALNIANNTEFGLTGAVYSHNRKNIEQARKEFHVGNLYLNRKCTGALVGVHPFGGFNMSGTDSKAGGKDYLLLFTQAKSVSEKY